MLIFFLVASAINILYILVYYKREIEEIELIASFGEYVQDRRELKEKIERHKEDRKGRKGFVHDLGLVFAILTPGFLTGCAFYVAIETESKKIAYMVLGESSLLGFLFCGFLYSFLNRIMDKTLEAADREIKRMKEK